MFFKTTRKLKNKQMFCTSETIVKTKLFNQSLIAVDEPVSIKNNVVDFHGGIGQTNMKTRLYLNGKSGIRLNDNPVWDIKLLICIGLT